MMIKRVNSFLMISLAAIATLGTVVGVKADTVNARCDVYPAGQDRATSSGPCTFSQRQGAVGIQLQNGRSYNLTPVGNQPGNYRDQNGRAAYRQSGLGDRGQIYRLANESIYVYWDTASSGQSSGNTGGNTTSATSAPEVGAPVPRLSDLVGARAGQAENTLTQRGYRFVRAEPSGDASYAYWRETSTNNCVVIRTANGRYESIVYGVASCN